MSTYIADPNYAMQALLVTLNIRQFSGRKEDKAVSKKIKQDAGADDDAGGFIKNIIPKEYLEPIQKSVKSLRDFHYENTLPWLDEGTRILPTQNYQEYNAQFEPLKDAFDSAVKKFTQKWPEIVEAARKSRGTLFKDADYPADIAAKFGVKLDYRVLPDTEDIRLHLSDEEKTLLKQRVEASMQEGYDRAMGDLYARLADGVKKLAVGLRKYEKDTATGKVSGVFRDSLVENLRELMPLIPRMNFAGDAELEAIRADVERDLCPSSADVLRKDDARRGQVAERAEEIAGRLGEFMR